MRQLLSRWAEDSDTKGFWRYFIDKRYWGNGAQCFDNARAGFPGESGYLKSLKNGFLSYCVKDPDHVESDTFSPPNFQLLKDMNAFVMQQLVPTESTRPYVPYTDTTDCSFSFGVVRGWNMTDDGFVELKTLIVRYDSFKHLRLVNSAPNARINGKYHTVHTHLFPSNYEHRESAANTIFDDYNSAINQIDLLDPVSENVDQKSVILRKKVAAIVTLVKSLEQLHFFIDGNARTICMLLLYRECIRNNIFPPLLDDPNNFDGHSQAELELQVYEGIERGLFHCPFFYMKIAEGLDENIDSELVKKINEKHAVKVFLGKYLDNIKASKNPLSKSTWHTKPVHLITMQEVIDHAQQRTHRANFFNEKNRTNQTLSYFGIDAKKKPCSEDVVQTILGSSEFHRLVPFIRPPVPA